MADVELVAVSEERASLTALVGAFVHAFPELVPVLVDHLTTREFLIEPDVLLAEICSSAAVRGADQQRVEVMVGWWRSRSESVAALRDSAQASAFVEALEARPGARQ